MSIIVHSSVYSGGADLYPDAALYPASSLYPGNNGGTTALVAVSTTTGVRGQPLAVSIAGGNATLSGISDGDLRELIKQMPSLSE